MVHAANAFNKQTIPHLAHVLNLGPTFPSLLVSAPSSPPGSQLADRLRALFPLVNSELEHCDLRSIQIPWPVPLTVHHDGLTLLNQGSGSLLSH